MGRTSGCPLPLASARASCRENPYTEEEREEGEELALRQQTHQRRDQRIVPRHRAGWDIARETGGAGESGELNKPETPSSAKPRQTSKMGMRSCGCTGTSHTADGDWGRTPPWNRHRLRAEQARVGEGEAQPILRRGE